MELLGRTRERQAIDRLLASTEGGQGGALVVRGDPGVGKTALLDDTAGRASGFGLLRSAGVEGEQQFSFAATHGLCLPILDRLDVLPAPQRDALAIAFGMGTGPAPNAFLVGLAVLGLLSSVTRDQPWLALVDDAHWLDRGSSLALGFVARRLAAERVALVVATRVASAPFARLPEVHLRPLGHRDARTLLETVLPGPLDNRVKERLIVEARGNPLALMELPRGMTPGQLAGGFDLPNSEPVDARIEASFGRRIHALPASVRLLLLVAASDPTGDAALTWRAADSLQIHRSAAAMAIASGLVTFSPRVAFRHPLVRSAIYGSASAEDRARAHGALADATDPGSDPDRRAWHRGQATMLPDEAVADDLAGSAERARKRGGYAAAATFLERSVALTVDPARRAARALAAAQAKYETFGIDDAVALLETADVGPLDDFQRAQTEVLRARIAFATNRGNDAPPLLLAAARRLESLDLSLARETYLDALTAALFSGRLASEGNAGDVARLALAAPALPEPRPVDLLLDGLAARVAKGAAAGTEPLRRAVAAFAADKASHEGVLRWRLLAARAAGFIWDFDARDELSSDYVRAARDAGMLAELPMALAMRAGIHIQAGQMADAAELVKEAETLADAIGTGAPPRYGAIALAAHRGDEDELTRLMRAAKEDFAARGEGFGVTALNWALAVLYNGLGRYEEAFAAAAAATEIPGEIWYATLALVELIEAGSRTGRRDRSRSAVATLAESTGPSGTRWARGIESRSRALLAEGRQAELLFREAIDCLERSALRFDLARAYLVYGEWLRREGRRVDARAALRGATDLFTTFGARAYAARARGELEATGAHIRRRTTGPVAELTAREAEVARLAADGVSNKEIAARLFISSGTVEYHLGKVFRKLEITSRTQLVHRLEQPHGLGGR